MLVSAKKSKGIYIPPTITGIDRRHPAAAYLSAAWAFNQGGTNLYDIAGIMPRGNPSGGPVIANGTSGQYIKFSTTENIVVPTSPAGPISCIIVCMRNADTATSGAATVQYAVGTEGQFGINGWYIHLGNGFGAAADKNKPRSGSVSSSASFGTVVSWIDGIKQSTNDPMNLSLVNNRWYCIGITVTNTVPGDSNLIFGQISSGVFGMTGGIAMVMLFKTALPDNIMANLTLDPTSILSFQEDFLFSQKVGGAFGVYNDPLWFGMEA